MTRRRIVSPAGPSGGPTRDSRPAWLLPILLVIALALPSLVSLSPAYAMQLTPQQKQEIKLHYERATRAYDLQKYTEAIDEYQKAYEIGGDPPMLYNIAQSYRLNDQPADAIRYYRRYLQRAPEARNREYVERKIADLERLIEERRKAAAAATPPPITVTPPAVTPPAVTPPPVVTPTLPVQPQPQPQPPPPEPSHAGAVVGWAMIGAGVIADGIAIYEGLRAKQKGDELTRLSKMNNQVFDPAIESAGKTANIAAIVLGIGGTALAITGAIVLITSGSSSDAPERRPATAQLRLVPWVGPGLVGGGASLRF
jgi:tetratricopeptide (TPR) repeat protein